MSDDPFDLAACLKIDVKSLDDIEAYTVAACLIDLANEAGDTTALDHAFMVLDDLEQRSLPGPEAARLHYFRANAWAGKRLAKPQGWMWISEEIDSELLCLRQAAAHPGFSQLAKVQRAQIYTNLGNLLNHIGRFVEAVEAWDEAIALVPRMGMANGNRGIGLSYYGGQLYDPSHNAMLGLAAREALQRALEPDAIVDSPGLEPAFASFQRYANAIDHQLGDLKKEDLRSREQFSLGRSRAERGYRQWCLDRHLFLNPLNDLGADPIAAHDILNLPTLVEEGLGEVLGPPSAIRHFNVLKQEYVTARYALYEAMSARGVHFSDRGVLLYDTMDFPAFGFAVERAKLAFRAAYALLDKTAYFLNDYLRLGHGERQVSFRNLWFRPKGKDLHPRFDGAANWPFRGLFWLSKDMFDDAFRSVTRPDARELYELRNHLEHKFVAVHDDILADMAASQDQSSKGLYDIGFNDLTARALRQLKLSRAALIYLSLGVHAEERRRETERDPGGLSMPMMMFAVRDTEKRRDWF